MEEANSEQSQVGSKNLSENEATLETLTTAHYSISEKTNEHADAKI